MVVVPSLALFALGLALALVEAAWRPNLYLSSTRAIGWTALGALACALSASPVARIARFVRPRHTFPLRLGPTRRALGISAAVLALAHATLALVGPLDGAWGAVLSWAYLRAGLVALTVLAALLATSFPRVVRALRVRLWKPLHRLAYVAAALVLVHLVLSPFAPRAITLGLFATLFVVSLGRFLPRRRSSP